MTTPDVYRDAEYLADVSGLSPGLVAGPPSSSSSSSHDERMRKIQSTTKVAYIDRLLRDLDILIYCELSALYYMDCSIILFATRAIVQLIFFTPKVPPFDPTRRPPYVSAILLSNLFCMLCHHLFAPPEAGEETRGYMHGGLLIDFIGQRTPVPLLRLLFMDSLVLVLNLVMLMLVVERVKTVEVQPQTQTTTTTITTTSTGTGTTTGEGSGSATAGVGNAEQPGQGQDHDLEERGILRGGRTASDSNARSEVESGEHRPIHTDDNDIDERTELLADPAESGLNLGSTAAKDSHPLDGFASGQAVIMEAGLVEVVREQWRYSAATAPRAQRPFVPSRHTEVFLRERLGLRIAANGRMERIPRVTAGAGAGAGV
ncbi:DSC4 family protein [Aspergillus homomorphus CBS 101889]|uniref:DUF1746-domain-containing protein n=1 Tax=Aspergillus homomorphus (strain CBS 101889) TaxID=1450537 RepID=A0A395HWW9_ASPHC|nr:DUF1746-domain-containing protein [Aspergillus homomorphus CBS 101889]RAL12287.1 DUF1746-domain-containing protein [Aspergillus homomorphus CBS 101889]